MNNKKSMKKKEKPVSFSGQFVGASKSIPLKISARSIEDLDELRLLAFKNPKEFSRRFFLNILSPAVIKNAKKLPENYHKNVNSKCMKILAALFVLYFEQKEKCEYPYSDAAQKMLVIYPEKVIFDESRDDRMDSSAEERLRSGYSDEGKNILRIIQKNKTPDSVLLVQLMQFLERMLEKITQKDKRAPDLLLAYNLTAVAREKLVDSRLWGENPCDKEYLTKEFHEPLSTAKKMFSRL